MKQNETEKRGLNLAQKKSGNAAFISISASSTQTCATAPIACARGFEPPTFWSVAKRSIQLS